MFTGIIEEIGEVSSIKHGTKSAVLNIKAKKVLENTKLGDSIAVNGVCLTVTGMTADTFSADVMAETVRRTGLAELKKGSAVNLERAMAADGRFGGHIVSGHIDGTGVITSYVKEDNAIWVTISADESILRLIVMKGSITIDGISLTVAYIDDKVFKVSIIPHTADETTLLKKGVGSVVNLENDVVGKYVEKLLSAYQPEGKNDTKRSSISASFLAENGFL